MSGRGGALRSGAGIFSGISYLCRMKRWQQSLEGRAYISLSQAAHELHIPLSQLPYSLRILLENALRNLDQF